MRNVQDRLAIVELYLRNMFPGAEVHRIHRVGDPYTPHFQPHDMGGEMWRAETGDRSYELGITDEALEEAEPEALSSLLRYNNIVARLQDCEPGTRLWILTRGVLTKAKLGEAPS